LCADALPVTDGVVPFSTIGALTDGPAAIQCEQGNDSNGQTFADIWYRYTSSCTGVLTVSTCEQVGGSADYDSDIKVYAMTSCGALATALLACNDDDPVNDCGGDPDYHSTVRVAVEEGMQYLIRLGGWGSNGDVGTGSLFIDCDPSPRACCLPDGTCATISPASCVLEGGTFQIDAVDCASGACPNSVCRADVCQMQNVTQASTSDASTPFKAADGFTPAVDVVVDAVCWWGLYVDFTPSANSCGAGAGDTFTIRYYTGTPPSFVAHGPFTANVVDRTQTAQSISGFPVYRYQALHPPVELLASTTYWIEIRNNLNGDCDWLWARSSTGDGTYYQDADGDGYEASELATGNMAFCLGFGDVIGACCLGDGSCAMLSENDCMLADGTFQGMLTHCLTEDCPSPVACPADLVTSATLLPPPDGVVDGADLAFLIGEWGANPGSPADIVTSATLLPPPDGVVDGADLAVLIGAWGPCD